MILITGTPRSATTFVCGIFEELGHRMTPKCWSEVTDAYVSRAQGQGYNVCEPVNLAVDVASGITGWLLKEKINDLERYQREVRKISQDREIVFKLSQLAFLREENLVFDRIIVCIRDIDTWLKSADHHSTGKWCKSGAAFLKKYRAGFDVSPNPTKSLGLAWRKESIELYGYLKDNGKNPLLYRCGDDNSLTQILRAFGINDITSHDQLKCWRGIRFK